jgi:hypothetical protein
MLEAPTNFTLRVTRAGMSHLVHDGQKMTVCGMNVQNMGRNYRRHGDKKLCNECWENWGNYEVPKSDQALLAVLKKSESDWQAGK